jgi:biotin carboxyl carrier protein
MKQSLVIGGKEVAFELHERNAGMLRFSYGGKEYIFSGMRLPDGQFLLERQHAPGQYERITGSIAPAGKGNYNLQLGAKEYVVSPHSQVAGGATGQQRLSPLAPMPDMVRQILVKPGDQVVAGQALVVIEAMKLQLTLPAGGDAMVEAVLVSEGQMVGEGAELVKLAARS